MKNTKRGFTLIEPMVVVAIVAIIASIAIPNMLWARLKANEENAVKILRNLPNPDSSEFSLEQSEIFVSEWIKDAWKIQASHGYLFGANMENSPRMTVYAWPVSYGRTGGRSFCRLPDGSMWQSTDLIMYQDNRELPDFQLDSAGKPVFERGTWYRMP